MGNRFQLKFIATLVTVGVQLIAIGVTDATAQLDTLSHTSNCFQGAVSTVLTIASSTNSQNSQESSNQDYQPQNIGGPISSQASGTR